MLLPSSDLCCCPLHSCAVNTFAFCEGEAQLSALSFYVFWKDLSNFPVLQSFVSYTRLAVQRAEDMSPPVLEDGTTVSTAPPSSESETYHFWLKTLPRRDNDSAQSLPHYSSSLFLCMYTSCDKAVLQIFWWSPGLVKISLNVFTTEIWNAKATTSRYLSIVLPDTFESVAILSAAIMFTEQSYFTCRSSRCSSEWTTNTSAWAFCRFVEFGWSLSDHPLCPHPRPYPCSTSRPAGRCILIPLIRLLRAPVRVSKMHHFLTQ